MLYLSKFFYICFMTAKEFNKIDSTYFLIEEKSKQMCKENNVDYFDYIGSFKRMLTQYVIKKKQIEIINKCDFNDFVSTRAILNKANFARKEQETNYAIQEFNRVKKELFSWLDKTKVPYFFILNPMYKYGAGIDYNNFGYKKETSTGLNNTDIAYDYAIYKLKSLTD